ncbi:MAG: mevalonate kinase [Anaerolineae bacterium]|nr:mevalonate kinase [Anaerolineae bacterium]
MPAFSASAPGKVILFGEHAVVYGQPAIAVPVLQVRAKAIVNMDPRSPSGSVRRQAPDIGLEANLSDLPESHPLAAVIHKAAEVIQVKRLPACTIKVTSTIPIAGGMGSGAAVSVAILRAFSASLGHPLTDEQVSDIAYQVEVIHHGTPSGIDNTVITYARPVYYIKDKPIELLQVKQPFILVIGDTGIHSPTARAVGDLRDAWEKDRSFYESLFDNIGEIASTASAAIRAGKVDALGSLMNHNHSLLQELGISSPALDSLVEAARSAGAQGAKLSGAGRGGSMIAMVTSETSSQVAESLLAAGAVRTITTEVPTT